MLDPNTLEELVFAAHEVLDVPAGTTADELGRRVAEVMEAVKRVSASDTDDDAMVAIDFLRLAAGHPELAGIGGAA